MSFIGGREEGGGRMTGTAIQKQELEGGSMRPNRLDKATPRQAWKSQDVGLPGACSGAAFATQMWLGVSHPQQTEAREPR